MVNSLIEIDKLGKPAGQDGLIHMLLLLVKLRKTLSV